MFFRFSFSPSALVSLQVSPVHTHPLPCENAAHQVLAVVIWWRFRALDLSTRSALGNSNNTNIASRQQKVRRKLYFVSVSILIPYLPLQILFFAQTIEFGMPWTIPYDFNRVHYGGDPLPSTLITFTTSLGTPFGIQNTNYIPILTAIPVFFVFGTTADAINSYRKFLLFFGLGVLFPRLHDEYVETRTTKAGKSFLSSWRTRSAAIWYVFPNSGTTVLMDF